MQGYQKQLPWCFPTFCNLLKCLQLMLAKLKLRWMISRNRLILKSNMCYITKCIKNVLRKYVWEIFDIYNIFFSDYCQLFTIFLLLPSNQYVSRDQWSPHSPLLILENIWNDRCTTQTTFQEFMIAFNKNNSFYPMFSIIKPYAISCKCIMNSFRRFLTLNGWKLFLF